MRATDQTQGKRPTAVYLLVHADGSRFKIGVSVAPLTRAAQLPECTHINWSQSRVAWFAGARAFQVESALHRALRPFQLRAVHQKDGHTEWFGIESFHNAVLLIKRMPIDEGQDFAHLLPIDGQPAQAHGQPVPGKPPLLDAWQHIEDVLLKVQTLLPIVPSTVPRTTSRSAAMRSKSSGQLTWVLRGLSGGLTAEHERLRMQVTNVETYTMRLAARNYHLVQLMEWVPATKSSGKDGISNMAVRRDLVLHLTSRSKISHWPGGADLLQELDLFTAQCVRINAIFKAQQMARQPLASADTQGLRWCGDLL